MAPSFSSWMLAQEARSMLTRLARVRPFALDTPMVMVAGVSPVAQSAIERCVAKSRGALMQQVYEFLRWIETPAQGSATPAEAQRRFTLLRLRFNAVLSQYYIFADVLTQRSQHETGVWLSGLDVVADDALALPGYYTAPPVVCYLDRGVGAAIRRARTRLPGGDENPVAIVRVPRERMVGSGIASSLVHEVGHQAAALLDLIHSMRHELHQQTGEMWAVWDRWISEILADFWSVARVGVASTLGLMGVVSLPRAFVFRVSLDDPHPFPWIRVHLSCAMGQALYPHAQWGRLAQLWQSFYPLQGLPAAVQRFISALKSGIPALVRVLLNHRPKALRGRSLQEVVAVEQRQPARLSMYWQSWRQAPHLMKTASPTLVFAAVGQAKLDGQVSPENESDVLGKLLTHWALRSTLNMTAMCADIPRLRVSARAT